MTERDNTSHHALDVRARVLRAVVGFAKLRVPCWLKQKDWTTGDERWTRRISAASRSASGCWILQVDAADRADFALHRVLHTSVMKRVSAYASTARSIANERAPALIAATKGGKACEDARDSFANAE